MDSKSKKNSTSSQVVAPAPPPDPPVQAEEKLERKKLSWKKCCHRPTLAVWVTLASVVLGVLAVLTVLKSICVIAVSIIAALAVKLLSQEHSGKIAALIVICVTAAVALSISIYALIAIFTKKNKPMKYAAIVLVLLAVLQLIITSSTLIVKEKDKDVIHKELTGSFRQALERNSRQVKKWSETQHNLKCCGLYSPEDYRVVNMPPYFAPDVPISCCPTFDPDRSPILQEREREVCKAKKDYYKTGCLHLVESKLHDASILELKVLIGYIILEALTSAAAFVVAKLRQELKRLENSRQDEEANKN